MEQNFKKVYVGVELEVSPEGKVRPVSITYVDGITYEVDRVRQVTRAHATKVVGTGIRYSIVVKGKDTFLFEDEGKWFVEGHAEN
ncbi:MAG: hypothetical protein BWY46_00019 [Firmicutes bacterium ADurb.Bin300]|nr:MAG: hypothetical protein BWY46_00019 [Firmicutes bacterium ADurb.Bin300]